MAYRTLCGLVHGLVRGWGWRRYLYLSVYVMISSGAEGGSGTPRDHHHGEGMAPHHRHHPVAPPHAGRGEGNPQLVQLAWDNQERLQLRQVWREVLGELVDLVERQPQLIEGQAGLRRPQAGNDR